MQQAEPRTVKTVATAAAVATAAVFCVPQFAALLAVPAGPLLAGATVAGLLAALGVLLTTGDMRLALYALAWAGVMAGWCAWSLFAQPWTRWPLTGLLCTCAALTLAGVHVIGAYEREITRKANAELSRLDAAERQRYERAFAGRHVPVQVAGIDTSDGSTRLRLHLPEDGSVTIANLEAATAGLEVALNLKPDTMRFSHAEGARYVMCRIGESDVMAEPSPMPSEWTPLTINQPLRIGVRELGGMFAVLLREVCTLVVGQRGAGKSNLANVFIAQLARCVDVIICVIDLKQGRMAAPWVTEWAQGRAERPAVDWVATDRDEAKIMLQALVRAGNARAGSGIGGEKHIPTTDHPAFMLVTDETAVIFGPGGPKRQTTTPVCRNWEPHPAHRHKHTPPGKDARPQIVPCAGVTMTNTELGDLGTDIVQRFRSEAIDVILFALRATVDMVGGGHMKAQLALRIGLMVETVQEANYLLEGHPRAARWLSKLRVEGAAVAQYRKQAPVIVKTDRAEWEQIGECARATWRYRPEPDPVTRAAMGDAWDSRWRRAAPWVAHLAAGAPVPAQAAHGGGAAVIEDLDVDAQWAGLMDRLPELHGAEERTDRQLRVRAIVLNHKDPLGVTPKWICRLLDLDEENGNGKAPTRETVQRWLREDVDAGMIRQLRYGRYGKP